MGGGGDREHQGRWLGSSEVDGYRDKGLLGCISIGGRTILIGGNQKKYWVVGKDTEGSALRPAFPLLFPCGPVPGSALACLPCPPLSSLGCPELDFPGSAEGVLRRSV